MKFLPSLLGALLLAAALGALTVTVRQHQLWQEEQTALLRAQNTVTTSDLDQRKLP